MKKCIIYVFSGTGNTLLISRLYKEYLTDYETTIWEVEQKTDTPAAPDPSDYDLIGIGHPVHGFNAPKIMWDFCKKLPAVGTLKNPGKKVFILTACGEGLYVNNFATQKIVRMMSLKGYDFIQQRRYVMPYNMIFRHSPEMVKSEYLIAQKYAQFSCNQLLEGKRTHVHKFHIGAILVPLFRILWLYAQWQSPFMKVDMKKCIKCMKCVKKCPYGNITFNEEKGKFKFGTKCVLCVRCSFNCPGCAISIGLLNNWRVNGDYKIIQTAKDENIEFPYFTKEKLHGLKKLAYLGYYKRVEKIINK